MNPLRHIPGFVAGVAATVLLCYLFGIDGPLTLGGISVRMVPATAACFILSAATVQYERTRTRRVRLICGVLSAAVLTIAGCPFIASQVVPYTPPAVEPPLWTISSRSMSIGTMILFITLGLWGLARAMTWGERATEWIGMFCMVVGTVAILGYITGVPGLFYFEPYHSTGMAIHTAVLFILLGIRLCLPHNQPRIKP